MTLELQHPLWTLDDIGDDQLYEYGIAEDFCDLDSQCSNNFYCSDELLSRLRSNDPDETLLYIDCLTDALAQDLGFALLSNTKVTRAELVLTDLTADGAYDDLLLALRTSTSLTSLKLAGTMFGSKTSAAVSKRFLNAIACSKNLEQLELYNICIPVVSMFHLLRNTVCLENLQLIHCNFIGLAQTLISAFAANSTISSLECMCLEERYLTSILVGTAPSLQRLVVDEHSSTTTDTAQALGTFLQASTNLTTLELISFRWTHSTFLPLATGLAGCRSLANFSLEHCRFDDGSTSVLERLLSYEGCQIQNLSLGGHMEFGSSQALANVLRKNRSIQRLDLDVFSIPGFESETFFRALVANRTLRTLNLGCLSKLSQCESFCRNFGSVSALRELSIELSSNLASHNNSIHSAFQRNSSLTKVRVTSDFLSDEMLQNFCRRNAKLGKAKTYPDAVCPKEWPHIFEKASETQQALDYIFDVVPILVGKGAIP